MPHSQQNAELTCLVISDGRRGIENQALGLAEALSSLVETTISKHIVPTSGIFKALPPSIQFLLKSKPKDYGITSAPKIAIGCGRQAIAALMALKKSLGADIFTVYVQDPRINPQHFDLVIAPEHDGLSGPNVQTMIGSPNRITAERLKDEVQKFTAKLDELPKPRVTVLIGGTSKTHKLTKEVHQGHMQAICTLAEQGMSVMLTTSRRTPNWAVEDYKKISNEQKHIWVWDCQKQDCGDNPYFAFLGAADAILATQDSTNMLTEACATGKPVFTLPMAGTPGKFAILYSNLKKRCHVVPFEGSIRASAYEPLNETARLAEIILQYIDKN